MLHYDVASYFGFSVQQTCSHQLRRMCEDGDGQGLAILRRLVGVQQSGVQELTNLFEPHLRIAIQGSPAIDKGGSTMKIVVIGGTGLIGSTTLAILCQGGHEVVAASPKSGINTITGEGLKEAMAGAQVVIDLANSPSFEDKAVLEFFETSGRNLLAAEAAAGVRHHVALSIVGTDRTPDNGYFRAKVAQEKLIEASGIPYTIIRATQFLAFLGTIAAASADGNLVRLSPGLFQPIAADDVAAIVADVALAAPRGGMRG